jgi:hypothetical protein
MPKMPKSVQFTPEPSLMGFRMTNEKFSITNFQFRLALIAACRAGFFVAKYPACPVNPVKTQILLELGRE